MSSAPDGGSASVPAGGPRLSLGMNTCFAVKRWPEPARWAELIVDELGLEHCQLTLDLVDPGLDRAAQLAYADAVRAAAQSVGLHLHSAFTGLAAYSSNLLLHPEPALRDAATGWFERAIELAAAAGCPGVGGFLGAFSVADASDPMRRHDLTAELGERMARLGERARACGLTFLLMENMAVPREPGSVIPEMHELEAIGRGSAVPWVLCLDLGHPCALHTGTPSDDPLAWLAEPWRHPPVLQVQQANRDGDHHWPFTPERNEEGLVHAGSVVPALRALAAEELHLFFEIIHAPEAPDELVLADLRQSVAHWQKALAS